jgi:glycosyltransferase involved in cell wall biosynthesis
VKRLLTIGHSYIVEQNRRLAHEIARAGRGRWEVTVAAPRSIAGEPHVSSLSMSDDEPCPVTPLSLRFGGHPHARFYSGGLRALLRQRWDLVHVWQEPYVLAAAQIASLTHRDAPLVFATFQNIPKRYPAIVRMLETRVMTRASGWVAFARTAYDAHRQRSIYVDRPVRVIPPGVDLDSCKPNAVARDAVRRALGVRADEYVIGFVGRLVPEKGVDVLLDALEVLRVPWHAAIVGRGPMATLAKVFARRHPGRVHLVDDATHDRVPRYMNAFDVLCAPSRATAHWREQFGRVLIEAMACGVPVIAADTGEIPHVVGDAGVLVSGESPGDWSRAIEVTVRDNEHRQKMSAHGLARVHERFAWPIVARQHLDFFEVLVAGHA